MRGRALVLLGLLSLVPATVSRAGGQLDGNDFTGLTQGLSEGSFAAVTVGIRWDTRCLPLAYRFNNAALPNAVPPLDQAATVAAIQTSLDRWNDIPTSFIRMDMVGEITRPRDPNNPFSFVAFDMVNEVNFLSGVNEAFGAISPSVSLSVDSNLTAGSDIDGDGDGDVFDPIQEGISTCADVDGDGDFELPAGFYPAGTIIDNDVSFNNAVTWTTQEPVDFDGLGDLQAFATHEFGHSHGLSHSAIDQLSLAEPRAATMLPFIFAFDADSELGQRVPSSDDAAWSSFVYPEGTSVDGLPALQAGDVAFDEAFGVVRGTVTHGERGLPALGAHVFAVDPSDDAVVVGAIAGTGRRSLTPGIGFVTDNTRPDFHLIEGDYALPVPSGRYEIAVEALDGQPISTANVSPSARLGMDFGLAAFNEAFINRFPPTRLFWPKRFRVPAGADVAADLVTPVDVNLDPFDTIGLNARFELDGVGFNGSQPGDAFAVRFPASEIRQILDAGLVPTGAAYRTFFVTPSTASTFARASLFAGRVNAEGNAKLLPAPLASTRDLLGQENDFSPFFFRFPRLITALLQLLTRFTDLDVFLVLELPTDFDSTEGAPPRIGLDTGQTFGVLGRSFRRQGDGPFAPDPTFNYMFRLISTLPQ